MSLYKKIQTDMYNAMKSGNREDTNTLRTTLSKLKDKVIEKRQDLSKEEEVKILQTLVKQHKESIELYEKGGRNELVEAEQKELEIIINYLPKMMGESDIKSIVKAIIDEVCATSMADMGKIMPEVMKRGKGLIDGKSAQKFVQELIG